MTYAAIGGGWLLMAWPTPQQLFLYIESTGGRLRRAAGDAWDVVRHSTADLDPHLTSLVLLDEDANDEIAVAGVGLGPNLDRWELRLAFGVGIASLIWLTVALSLFNATSDLVLGAIPTFVAAVIAAIVLTRDIRHQRLVWR